MSFAEIITELPRLSRPVRRDLARRIFDMEDEEATLLREIDQRADERFLMLDAMEEEDGKGRRPVKFG